MAAHTVGVRSGALGELAAGLRRKPDSLLNTLPRLGKVRNFGTQALQLCYVAAGRLSANISREAKIWDDAAGALIVAEAGGVYARWDGHSIFPFVGNLASLLGQDLFSLAAHPEVADSLRALLAPLTREPAL